MVTILPTSEGATEKEEKLGKLESVQDAMIRRFNRTFKQPEPVVFEFTDDKALLHQYYRLRDQAFGRDIASSDGSGGADVYDKISDILVARRGKLVIGACRVTFREGDESFLLPMEDEDFQLRNIFPDLPLAKERHAVFSKFAILEEHRQQDILHGLCKIMYDKVVSTDTHYVFVRTTSVLARNRRMIANSFGAKHTRICTEVTPPPIPNFDEKAYLVMSDLTELCQIEFPRMPVPTKRELKLVE